MNLIDKIYNWSERRHKKIIDDCAKKYEETGIVRYLELKEKTEKKLRDMQLKHVKFQMRKEELKRRYEEEKGKE